MHPSGILSRLRGLPYTILVVVMLGLFTDSFLYGMLVPLTGELRGEADDDAGLAIMYGGYAVGMMVSTPFFGILSDRLGRRRPMIWGVLGQMAAAVIFATAQHSFALLMLGRIVQGAAAAATWTAALALVAQTNTHKRTQMMGIAMLGGTAGSVLGPILGGFLLEWGGLLLPFLAAGALLAIDLVLRAGLLVDPPRQANERPDLLGLLRDPAVLVTALIIAVGVGGWGLLEPLLPNQLRKDVAPSTIGLMFTVATFFYGLCAPLVERAVERWGLRPTMAFGLLLMALSLPLIGIPNAPFLVGAALTLTSALYAFALNPTFAELAEAVDRRGTGSYASVYAVYNIAFGAGMIGSDVVAGFLTHHTSFQTALLAASGVMLAAVPALYFGRPRRAPHAGAANEPQPVKT